MQHLVETPATLWPEPQLRDPVEARIAQLTGAPGRMLRQDELDQLAFGCVVAAAWDRLELAAGVARP
jgi:hypothetical protein